MSHTIRCPSGAYWIGNSDGSGPMEYHNPLGLRIVPHQNDPGDFIDIPGDDLKVLADYCWSSELRDARAELLRVRTTGHGAAHELDNIAVEAGLGHSPSPGKVAEYVRAARAEVGRLAEAVKLFASMLSRIEAATVIPRNLPFRSDLLAMKPEIDAALSGGGE